MSSNEEGSQSKADEIKDLTTINASDSLEVA